MSTEETKKPESELGLDLDLHFLPAWAQQPSQSNRYESFTGEEGADDRRERRGGRGRGGFGGGGGGERRDRGPRREGGRPPGAPGGPGGQFRGDRGQGRGGDRGRGPRHGGPHGGGRPQQMERPQIKLPDLEVTFIPEEKGVESLARQIKLSGRAYPLFEIAYLVLKKPERYHVQLTSKKKEDGTPAQFLYICGLDDTLWLDENEAMLHVLDKHFGTFYSTEKIPTEPPKGVYTFVAQCGMSGAILGPPNYHDYQNKLRKLHQERFSRMPFDMFKSRIKIVKDEAVVKKWLEEQSFRTEFTCLNIPETIKLNTREEVEKHFRETHQPNVIKAVDSYTMPGTAAVNLQNRALQSLLRRSYDEQMRFPLKVVNILSGQFARQGLQFFKVNKSVTHVAVARPRYLDLDSVAVSEGVRKIVEFINAHPRTTRKKLLEALAPGATVSSEAPAASSAPPAAEAAPSEPQAAAAEVPQPETPVVSGTSPEAAVIGNLHWLIHQGHVIEFANGILETAKKPLPRPPRPEKKKKEESGSAETGAAEAGAAQTEQPDAEVTTQEGIVGEGAEAEAAGPEGASAETAETSEAQESAAPAAAEPEPKTEAAAPASENPPAPAQS